MPQKTATVDLESLENLAKNAKQLKKLLTSIYTEVYKGPSYTGKSRFIDRIKKAEDIAHVLEFDLAADVAEAKDRKG